MTKRIVSIAAATLFAAAFAGQAFSAEAVSAGRVVVTSQRAQAEDAGLQQYRAAVLGEGRVSTASHRAADRVAPSSHALYLIRNGVSKSDALARASALGDQPAYRIVQNDGRALNAIELNDKRLGNTTLQAQAFATPVAAR